MIYCFIILNLFKIDKFLSLYNCNRKLYMIICDAFRREILRTEQLALYVHAMVVSCLNPHDFHGHDLVSDLRKRVNLSKYTNPLAFLVLCNAGENMTSEDVQRLNGTYFVQHRSYWTGTLVIDFYTS